ncbi:unnamed protein product [Phytophthora fragariaefolia]|uniref:Unnamed protein product n=1 Tax=Phytophthora fragariaefolia TaxID=1490495 RepID=A0A9W6TQI6_9STRA|nr:unnamed protein product [Phytophthora fragariaefolia]
MVHLPTVLFRYCQRTAARHVRNENNDNNEEGAKNPGGESLPTGIVPAATVAAAISSLIVEPENRPALVALLSSNAASHLFRNFLAKNRGLAFLKPLELVAFMIAGGWIFSSGFFYPESYERSHMKTILKCVLLKPNVAFELQEKYGQGLNPNPCHVRHEGLSCGQFARSSFLLRVMGMSLRLYVPVHFMTWLLAQRHHREHSKASNQLKRFVTKLIRSSVYAVGYVYLGWTLCCMLGKLGDRSRSLRKLQFFLSGALPSLAILAESPARRHSIGLILTSYALVSAGNVATQRNALLQPGGSLRGLLEAGSIAAAVSAVIPSTLKGSQVLQRILLGDDNRMRVR